VVGVFINAIHDLIVNSATLKAVRSDESSRRLGLKPGEWGA
jgi:hypothetical protein